MAEETYIDRTSNQQEETVCIAKAFNITDVFNSFKRFAKPVKSVASKIADYTANKLNDWFYFHEVLGQHGKTIYALKFRTMHNGANDVLQERLENNGFDKLGKPNDKDYIMPKRAWMRKIFVDEIPQIFYNIIFQENMSFVGERPQPAKMWTKQIEDGKVTKEEMKEALQYSPGLFGVHYRHPELDSFEARREYRAFKESRPGSADLDYFIRICHNIIFKGLRSK